jgi:hypothetical protein
LEVEANGAHTTYWDDFYGCRRSDPSTLYVHSIGPLEDWLNLLAHGPVIPQDIATILMRRSPHFEVPPAVSSSCDKVEFWSYKLDVSTHALEWQSCTAAQGSNVYARVNGTRVLTDGEMSPLLARFATLEAGASAPCAGQPTAEDHWASVEVTAAGQMSPRLLDEEGSCSRRWSQGIYVVNLRALEQAIELLAR